MVRRRVGVGIVLAMLVVGGISPSAESQGRHRRRTRFAGSCEVQGTVAFDPPVTLQSQQLTYDYPAKGTCNGTLNGVKLSNAAITLHQSGPSEGSCASAETTAPGDGRITFRGGRKLRYTVEFTSVASEIDFTFHGKRSGTATGHGTFNTDRTPDDKAAECATGLSNIPMDMTLTTESPLVSRN